MGPGPVINNPSSEPTLLHEEAEPVDVAAHEAEPPRAESAARLAEGQEIVSLTRPKLDR